MAVPSDEGERLQKVLARVGIGSRRVCEDLIAEGRVTVDGEVAVLGRRVDVETALIELDGAPIGVRPDLVHYLLNKPAGVVTTADDPQGRHQPDHRGPTPWIVGRRDHADGFVQEVVHEVGSHAYGRTVQLDERHLHVDPAA